MALSLVDPRLGGGLAPSAPSRLSMLLCRLRGGVSGEGRGGRSVGRKTAGTYIGHLGGRSCRVASRSSCGGGGFRGDVGDTVVGVAEGE